MGTLYKTIEVTEHENYHNGWWILPKGSIVRINGEVLGFPTAIVMSEVGYGKIILIDYWSLELA